MTADRDATWERYKEKYRENRDAALREHMTTRERDYYELGKRDAGPRILTADDPEPTDEGTIIITAHGGALERYNHPIYGQGWYLTGDPDRYEYTYLLRHSGPLTLVYTPEGT